MIEIITPSAYLLSGVALYACFTHLQVGLRRPVDPKHLLFAAMSLFASASSAFQAMVLKSETIPDFVLASRWNLSLTALFAICMIWFVAAFTRIAPRLLLYVLTAGFVTAIIAILTRPYGIQTELITRLTAVTLPWGETYTTAEGQPSVFLKLGLLTLLGAFAYVLYAIVRVVCHRPTRGNVGMLIAVVLYVAFYTEGALARTNVIACLPMGPYGILGFTLAMSLVLNQEHNESRRAAALAVELERKRLAIILKTVDEDIYIVDAQGTLVEANDSFLHNRGLDASAIGELNASAWNCRLDADTLAQRISHILDAGRNHAFESRHCHRDGREFDVEINANVFSHNGKRYILNSARDITGRKQRQLELEREVAVRTEELATARADAEAASAVKTRLLTNFSHEMRTPMSGILGFAEIGKNRADKQSEEKLATYFEKIQVSGKRLHKLIESLISLAEDSWKQQAGIDREGFRSVSPEKMAIQCISLMEKTAASRRQTIVYENTSTIPTIEGDESRLRQVMEHLLKNAMTYSPEDTTIRVSIADQPAPDRLPTRISIKVMDQGCGVPEKEMNAIFEPFYESSRTATGAGNTGLGLALSKSILARHGGTIGVSNRPEGGAVFEVVLPRG